MTKPKDSVDLDPILEELGQFGRSQLKTYCLILVPIMLTGVYNSQYVFTAADVEYRCKVPECESSPPAFAAGAWAAWALVPGQPCVRRVPARAEHAACAPQAFLNETQRCGAWLYENSNSIVSEFDLACQSWKRALVGTVHSAGMLTALCFTGFVSDTLGRRTAFVLTAASRAPTGLLRALSTNYVMFVVLEFVDAALGSGVYSTGFVLALEMISRDGRVLAGNLIPAFFALGQVLLALVAWAIPHWQTLTLVFYLPAILFLLYFFLIQESVRWLLSKGRKAETAEIIFKAAATNGVKLSADATRQLTEETTVEAAHELSNATREPQTKEQSLASQVLRSRVIMSRLCICSFWWMTLTFIYYGLSINSVSLAGNMYVNYILTSLVEIPGYALSVLTLDRFGRKSSIMTAFVICGIALICLPFVPKGQTGLVLTLNLTGKLWISMAFGSMYIYALELFPTQARTTLLALCSMVGRLGQIAAPMTPLLMEYMASLPYLLFGALAGGAALLMLLTPETLRLRLPDTVAQAEAMAAAPRSGRRADLVAE